LINKLLVKSTVKRRTEIHVTGPLKKSLLNETTASSNIVITALSKTSSGRSYRSFNVNKLQTIIMNNSTHSNLFARLPSDIYLFLDRQVRDFADRQVRDFADRQVRGFADRQVRGFADRQV
jgi:hypothetical protein